MMYAPKFRSWMSSWDRFEESLEYRLQQQGDEILAEARRQLEAATPKQPPPTYNPYLNIYESQGQLEGLYNQILASQQVNRLKHGYQQPPAPFTEWFLGFPSL